MIIIDYTGRYPEKVLELDRFFSIFPVRLPSGIPLAEIWNSARDTHTPEEIAQIQRGHPHFDPDESSGEFSNGAVRLFSRAFEFPNDWQTAPPDVKAMRPIGILLHEIGHCLLRDLRKQRRFSIKQWNRVRRADGERSVSRYVEDMVWRYGFFHKSSCDEDFADSLRFSILESERFAKRFPNRFAFCQKFIIQSHP